MLFNSWVFALFLPVVLVAYYSLRHRRQNVLLLVASYVFYGWWDWRFCGLLLVSTLVDYTVGRTLGRTENPRRRKLLLVASCLTNLGILGFFKYFDFFAGSLEALFATLGLGADLPTLRVLLPVGISFYTFQTLSYTIDVYRRRLEPCRRVVDFAVYVAFFPQLVAGPIERATRLLPQIQRARTVDWDKFASGSLLILIGLFRKIAIADAVAPIVTGIFADPAAHGSFTLLIGVYLFSLQIYGDFAGYSDIARGTARLLGFELIENFQHPYFSTSITEFWRRWHVSLSTWLRDYLYIPLGGNRRGAARTYANLAITMLLGGLWHGASWVFVVWGGLHGLYLAIHKLMLGSRAAAVENRERGARDWAVDVPKMVLTFHLVALTWIFFRAGDFATAWAYLTGIGAWSGGLAMTGVKALLVCSLLLFGLDAAQYRCRNHTVMLRWPVAWRAALYAGLVLAMFALRSDGEIPFIYFQF